MKDNLSMWAATLTVKDEHYSRRTWKYFFGVKQLTEDTAHLSYAKSYFDYMADSMSIPKSVSIYRDAFPDCLFFGPNVQCKIGEFVYPTTPVELTAQAIDDLTCMIFDKTRTIPIMLISCPDVVSPEEILDIALGNIAVFWCSVPHAFTRLNSILPNDMNTKWDSVRIFMPISRAKVFHPVFSYDDLHAMGIENSIRGIKQAYCYSLRSDEYKHFPTVEGIRALQAQNLYEELFNRNVAQKKELEHMTQMLIKANDELESVRDELHSVKETDYKKELAEFEDMLNDTLKEMDSLKEGISNLCSRLYCNMGKDFALTPEQPIALLQELTCAIYSALSCARSKR